MENLGQKNLKIDLIKNIVTAEAIIRAIELAQTGRNTSAPMNEEVGTKEGKRVISGEDIKKRSGND